MVEGQTRGLLSTVLAHRDLRLLLGGQAASQTGDWLYSVSLLAFVYSETDSPAWVAAAGVVRLLPYLVFGTLGGVLADRYERRAVMIASDLVRAATMFALALAALSGSVTVALVIVAISVIAATPYQPALSAMIPSLVPEKDLAAANSAMSVIENVALALSVPPSEACCCWSVRRRPRSRSTGSRSWSPPSFSSASGHVPKPARRARSNP